MNKLPPDDEFNFEAFGIKIKAKGKLALAVAIIILLAPILYSLFPLQLLLTKL